MAFSETELLQSLLTELRSRLPKEWTIALEQGQGGASTLLRLTPPRGKEAVLVVEAKRVLDPKDVPRVAEELLAQAEAVPRAQPLVVAPFLSPRTRERLIIKGINYWDQASNAHLQLTSPIVVISTTGEDRNPEPEERALKSLRGRAAGRAVRALCDFRPPYGIRELAGRSETPAPSLSRVVELLEREAIVERESPRKPITKVDWEALLRRWVQDYDFAKSNQSSAYLEPRGLATLLDRLRSSQLRCAVTSTFAAEARGAAVSAPRLMTLFVENAADAARILALRPAETGGNVLLAEPFDPVVFERTAQRDGINYAAPSQAVADLLTGPGRAPADGEALLSWMKENEGAWRA